MNTSDTLRMIALDDAVVFPNMGITLTVDVGDDERVVLVPRHDNEYIEVGTVADVSEHVRLPGGGRAVTLTGLHRAYRSGPDRPRRRACASRSTSGPTRSRSTAHAQPRA